ncbi:MAG: zf-HC2 domain-containing protein [bacterium]
MNDCPNAEIRDQLPDLVHNRLDAGARVAVMMHIDGCADCRAELAVLRGVHAALASRTPRVNVQSIVAALPKPEHRLARPAARQRTWANWRVAAAVVFLVAGGTSVALLRGSGDAPPIVNASAPRVAPVTGPVAADTTTRDSAARLATRAESTSRQNASTAQSHPAAPTETVVASGEGLGVSGHLGDLDDRQLQALLDDIDHMEAVPITEPEPVTIKVEPRTPLPGPGRGR